MTEVATDGRPAVDAVAADRWLPGADDGAAAAAADGAAAAAAVAASFASAMCRSQLHVRHTRTAKLPAPPSVAPPATARYLPFGEKRITHTGDGRGGSSGALMVGGSGADAAARRADDGTVVVGVAVTALRAVRSPPATDDAWESTLRLDGVRSTAPRSPAASVDGGGGGVGPRGVGGMLPPPTLPGRADDGPTPALVAAGRSGSGDGLNGGRRAVPTVSPVMLLRRWSVPRSVPVEEWPPSRCGRPLAAAVGRGPSERPRRVPARPSPPPLLLTPAPPTAAAAAARCGTLRRRCTSSSPAASSRTSRRTYRVRTRTRPDSTAATLAASSTDSGALPRQPGSYSPSAYGASGARHRPASSHACRAVCAAVALASSKRARNETVPAAGAPAADTAGGGDG